MNQNEIDSIAGFFNPSKLAWQTPVSQMEKECVIHVSKSRWMRSVMTRYV